MPKVTYIQNDGLAKEVDVACGTSLMRAALQSGVAGILAECGGNAMCATCHVYVDENQLHLLPEISEEEDALLDGVATERCATSRLSCQIHMSAPLSGLKVVLPEKQT